MKNFNLLLLLSFFSLGPTLLYGNIESQFIINEDLDHEFNSEDSICLSDYSTSYFIGPEIYNYEVDFISPPPDNDLCSGATDLGTILCNYSGQYFEDPTATPDPEATGICISSTDIGQWYTFMTPSPMNYSTLVLGTSIYNTEIFKSTSGCAGLEYVTCGIGIFGFNPEPATTYYLLTTGGHYMFTILDIEYSCTGFNVPIDFSVDNPYVDDSTTDCGTPSDDVPCENDHTIWYSYTVGCSDTDLLIEVSEFTGDIYTPAQELSITVFVDDCETLASDYDINGLGYICNGLSGGSLTLENIPPGTSLSIVFGSENGNNGHFNLSILETSDGDEVVNEVCVDATTVYAGVNVGLTNFCSSYSGPSSDWPLSGCEPNYEATVWYVYDPGGVSQDLTVTVIADGISSPAIGAFDDCGSINGLGINCSGSMEYGCVSEPIYIEVGSSLDNVGSFNLEILATPSEPEVEIVVTGADICSHNFTDLVIETVNGELVDIIVNFSGASTPQITGMNVYNFYDVNSVTIEDLLINPLTTPGQAVYAIYIYPTTTTCIPDPIEFSITVYPDFTSNDLVIESCLPHTLQLNVYEVVQGGSPPFTSVTWYWNGTELIGMGENLSYDITEEGEITVEIIDDNGCMGTATVFVEISEPTIATFDFPLEYCRHDQDFIYFPNSSLESIEGIWNPAEIDLANTPDGTYEILFIPGEGSCSQPETVTIEIFSGVIPEFDLASIFCPDGGDIVFPDVDINGNFGYWDFIIFYPEGQSGSFTNTFTPVGVDCFSTYEHTFEITANIELTFNQPDSVCTSDEPITLDGVSQEGYNGSWDTPIINPSMISGDSIVITWTPEEGQSLCLEETVATIYILESLSPQFDLPNELCASDSIFNFPAEDNQAIVGNWTLPMINANDTIGLIQSIFVPIDECIESYVWEISVVEPIIPTFNIDTSYCSLDTAILLPTISDDGIFGSWSTPILDPMSVNGQNITLSFTGESLDTCAGSTELIFEIQEAVIPEFDIPSSLCWLDANLTLPTSSSNAIEGSWNPAIIEIQENIGETVEIVFLPSDSICAEKAMQYIDIIAPYSVGLFVNDPSDCVEEDGSIIVDVGSILNLEFSIDGGATWQSEEEFNNLSSGGYTVLFRSSEYVDCILEQEAFLNAANGPMVNDVLSTNVSSCITYDGIILVDAEGSNLEYSIDGGLTWQVSNEFNSLPPGDYIISIRELSSNCIVEATTVIEDFVQTELIIVNQQDISDCNEDDGIIEIIAIGESLEYSIDNGASWSIDNVFDNLPEGEYEIIVQSTVGEDCIVESMVILEAPNTPEVIDVFIQPPTVCSNDIGVIQIDANGENLEFSFDGGLTWQSGNMIMNVSAGSYDIIVRDADKIQCFVEANVVVMEDEDSLMESEFMITVPSDCDLADGTVEVTNSELNLEFSIDGSVTWQTNPVFNDLPSGMYNLISRKIAFPDCLVEQALEIPDVDCNCLDLTIEYSLDQIPCDDSNSAIIDLTSVVGPSTTDYEISWSDGSIGPKLSEVGEGWHYFTILYDEHCTWEDSIYVEVNDPILFELVVSNSNCMEIDSGEIEIINVDGGNGVYLYSIDDGATFQEENIFNNLPVGEYNLLVSDGENCFAMQSVEIETPQLIEIELSDIITIIAGENIILDPQINESTIDSFIWSTNSGILTTESLSIEISPSESTTYSLEIFYDDCYDSKTITVEVNEQNNGIFFSNIFSPNQDNFNDIFYIQGIPNDQISINSMLIFDRWGNNLFHMQNPMIGEPADGWKGDFNGTNVIPGVYVYKVNYTEDNVLKTLIGSITLVR